MGKVKKFLGSKSGKVLKSFLVFAAGAAQQEFKVPYVSEALSFVFQFLGA